GELDGVFVDFEKENSAVYPTKYQLRPTEPEMIRKIEEKIKNLNDHVSAAGFEPEPSMLKTLVVPKLRAVFDFSSTYQKAPQILTIFGYHEMKLQGWNEKAKSEVEEANAEAEKKAKEKEEKQEKGKKTKRQQEAEKELERLRREVEITQGLPKDLEHVMS